MENEALARRWFEEVWNQRRTDTVRELLTDDSVCHSEGGPLRGAEAFLENAHRPFLAAFPDLQVQVEDTVSQGDVVVVRWTATATHAGDGLGMAPTAKRVTFRGMTWIRYKNGKMIEGWDCWNHCGLMQALGGGPIPPSIVVA